MHKLELMDLDFNGPQFTWRGMRHGQLMEARLDRVLVNDQWQLIRPRLMVTHDVVLTSYHCPLVLHGEPRMVKGNILFRFQAFWVKEAGCKEIVNQV